MCLLASGCNTAKNVSKTLGELEKIRTRLMKKFGEEGVNVNLSNFENQNTISVTYINSPLNQKTVDEREKRAQETAELVKQHAASITKVDQIWVGFMRQQTRLMIFHYSEMLDVHGFDAEAQPLQPSGSMTEDPSEPLVRYSASQDRSDISGSNIQLEGTSEKGVMFLPHFSVAGNANKTMPEPPKEIELDFAAFSDKPRFPNLTKLVFLADDKIAYQTKGQFSTSKIAGDMYSEYLYLKIPTAAFLKISSGKTVKLKLNDHEYTLTDIQLKAIQRMSDYLRG